MTSEKNSARYVVLQREQKRDERVQDYVHHDTGNDGGRDPFTQ